MTQDILKQMYMRYVSNLKKDRKVHIDISTDQIIPSKKGKKKKPQS